MDHFVQRELRPGTYVRYVDDFLLFGDDQRELREMRASLEEFLQAQRLRIHGRKSRVYRTRDGVTFLGWRVFPDRVRLVRTNVVRWRRRMKLMADAYRRGEMRLEDVTARVRAWIAHALHGDTRKLRAQLLAHQTF
jgi:hypothetical protein